MSYNLNKIMDAACRLLRKLRITFQGIFKKKTINNYKDAVEFLNEKNPDCKTSCITKKEDSNTVNYQLSIIIPVYNCEKYVERCINSILSQKMKYTYEIVVVNDGSTDNTKEVLKKFRSVENIHIIEQENKGYSGARNAGIDFATGRYLMFVDSDDEMLAGGAKVLLDRAYEYDADIVEGGFKYIYPNDKCIDTPSSDEVKEISIPFGILSGFFWGKVYKREIFEGIRLPEGYWFEDSLNVHILFWKCKKCILIPELVYGYYMNENGITQTAKKKIKSIDSLYITESLIKDHLELGYNITQEYYDYFLRMVNLTYNRTREMKEEVRKSFFLCQCNLYEKYFSTFSTEVKEMKKLEHSLKMYDYKAYIFALEW